MHHRASMYPHYAAPAQPPLAPSGEGTIARYRLGLIREATVPFDTTKAYDRPERIAPFLHGLLETYEREVMGALFLTANLRAVGHTLPYQGTLTHAAVEPRGLLIPALMTNAAGVVLFHNHPSGDPTPSSDDIAVTKRVVAAGKLLGVSVLDHLILGEAPRYTSLWQLDPW